NAIAQRNFSLYTMNTRPVVCLCFRAEKGKCRHHVSKQCPGISRVGPPPDTHRCASGRISEQGPSSPCSGGSYPGHRTGTCNRTLSVTMVPSGTGCTEVPGYYLHPDESSGSHEPFFDGVGTGGAGQYQPPHHDPYDFALARAWAASQPAVEPA